MKNRLDIELGAMITIHLRETVVHWENCLIIKHESCFCFLIYENVGKKYYLYYLGGNICKLTIINYYFIEKRL